MFGDFYSVISSIIINPYTSTLFNGFYLAINYKMINPTSIQGNILWTALTDTVFGGSCLVFLEAVLALAVEAAVCVVAFLGILVTVVCVVLALVVVWRVRIQQDEQQKQQQVLHPATEREVHLSTTTPNDTRSTSFYHDT